MFPRALSSFLNVLSLLHPEFITSVGAVLVPHLGFSVLSGVADFPSPGAYQLNTAGFGAGAEAEMYPLR